jgi:hypothetical protein
MEWKELKEIPAWVPIITGLPPGRLWEGCRTRAVVTSVVGQADQSQLLGEPRASA